ncbi:MAG: hypothetical protein ACRC62_27105 [Microcoleus sp.]
MTPKDASIVLNPVAKNLNLPYTDDWQLDYYAQEAPRVVQGRDFLSARSLLIRYF